MHLFCIKSVITKSKGYEQLSQQEQKIIRANSKHLFFIIVAQQLNIHGAGSGNTTIKFDFAMQIIVASFFRIQATRTVNLRSQFAELSSTNFYEDQSTVRFLALVEIVIIVYKYCVVPGTVPGSGLQAPFWILCFFPVFSFVFYIYIIIMIRNFYRAHRRYATEVQSIRH